MKKKSNLKGFKLIPGYPGYRINKNGEVYSDKRKIILAKQESDKYWPYEHVMMCINGKNKPQSIHKLLALAFIPLPDGYYYDDVLYNYRNRTLVVNHIDSDKNNNSIENLEWLTDYENLVFDSAAKQHRREALKGNQNSKGHTYSEGSKKRYVYHYNGNDYTSMKAVAVAIGTTTSVISEHFRKNLHLVKDGIITRDEFQKN